MTVAEQFAEFALRSRKEGLDPAVRLAAIRATVDWFAATAAGALSPPASILRETLLEEGSSGQSMLLGDPRRVDASSAALINGTASHAVEFDDIYREGIYHPGSPTVAAALAAAQRIGASGADLLRGIAVGYEIGDHISAVVNPALYRFWHTTAAIGVIGAAAAVAELLELDEFQFANALAIATTMAAGFQQSFRSDSMAKPLHAGHAAQAGITAGFAASKGFTGALDVLEGEAGLGAAMSKDVDWNAATSSLGEPWLIQQPTVKMHSCCGHTFAALDAALEFRESGIDPERIASVSIESYDIAIKVAGIADPRTPAEARFSIAYCVAAALVLGSVRIRAFEPDTLVDPRLRRLVENTTISVDPDIDARFPHQRAARVRITLDDGQETVIERWTRKGDPDDPVSEEELRGKFVELATPLYGEQGAEEMARTLWSLDQLDDVRSLNAAGGNR